MVEKATEETCNCILKSSGPNANVRGPNLSGIDGPNAPNFKGVGGLGVDGFGAPDVDVGNFKWPGINEPGFPTLIAGCLGASIAGLGLLKDFIPIKLNDNGTPKIPDLPGIDIFVKGFTGAASGLPSIRGTSIPVPGVGSIPLPDISGIDIPSVPSQSLNGEINFSSFDPTILLKIIGLFIGAPFLIIKGIIESIPTLNIGIPDIPGIFLKAGAAMGINLDGLGICVGCISEAILNLIKVILPI